MAEYRMKLVTLFSKGHLALEVAQLEGHAPLRHSVRAMDHAGRATGVHARREGLLLAEVRQFALEDPDLLPEVVDDRLARLHARVELQESRHVALLVTTQDLLLDPGTACATRGRGGHRLPGQMVRLEELELGFGHGLKAPSREETVSGLRVAALGGRGRSLLPSGSTATLCSRPRVDCATSERQAPHDDRGNWIRGARRCP